MKVKFEKEDKKYFTIAEAPIVRKIIQDMKETEESAADTVEYAMHAMEVWENYEVLKASAKISHNCRVYNYFSDDICIYDVSKRLHKTTFTRAAGHEGVKSIFQWEDNNDKKNN